MFPVYIDQPKHLKVFLVVKWWLREDVKYRKKCDILLIFLQFAKR